MYEYRSPKADNGKTVRSLSMALAASAVVMGFIGIAMPNPASAREQTGPRQEIVRYHDLDLRQAADADQLDMRIRRAAKRVCAQPGLEKIVMRRKIRQCTEQAYGRAWASASAAISRQRLAIHVTR